MPDDVAKPTLRDRWETRPALYVHLEVVGHRESTPADFGSLWHTGLTICGQRIVTTALTTNVKTVTCSGCLAVAEGVTS